MKLVITGGHHTSALPVLESLRRNNADISVFWIGHKYSVKGDKNPTLEFREISALNIPFYNLHAGKFYKTYDPIRLAKIPFGFFEALYVLLKIKPDTILSFGGYLAVPVVLAGWVLGIPSVTHEQTTVAGYANKLISRFSKKVLLSWPSSEKYFPKGKTQLVGIPIRQEVFEVKSSKFDVSPDLPTIYITAGKTGSHKINEVVLQSLPDLLSFCNVIHQCGDHSEYNDYQTLCNASEKFSKRGSYFVEKFILSGEIGEVYAKSSLVVSRSGAHTTLELLALEKPSILIPIPWVSHNEQYENALILKDAGLSVILEEKNLNKQSLILNIKETLHNIANFQLNSQSLKSVINLHAANDIISQVLTTQKSKGN